MLGKVLELSIIICMENHYYMLGGEVRRQASGAGIGLRCSEALGRAFGLGWDRRLVARLQQLGWPPLMIQRYVAWLGQKAGGQPTAAWEAASDDSALCG